MTERTSGNLLADLPVDLPEEQFDPLLDRDGLTLARIVSTGQSTPNGDWYDQERDEWVLVMKGRAGLRFEDEDSVREMGPGDHVMIPAHARHRVEWTSETEPTVWLVLHVAHPAADVS
jgi:cupin 2 domain-containing protein